MAGVLAALKHTPQLLNKRAYRRARRVWFEAFKQLRSQVDRHTNMCATGEALLSRGCEGYRPWEEICKKRDSLPMGSIERLLLELHTHAIGRSREYAAVKIFNAPPTKEQRRAWPNHIVLQDDPLSSYLRMADYKTSRHLGAYKLILSPALHQAIVASLHKHPRAHLFEPPSSPGQPSCQHEQL